MTDYHTPRRPLVPSPGLSATSGGAAGGSITQRAIELRERSQTQQSQPGLVQKHDEAPFVPPLVRVPGPVGKIAGAIADIMSKVGTIKKTGYNAFHKYHYVRMEDMLEVITPLMGAAGLAVIQNEIEIKSIEGNRVAVVYEFSIFHKSGEIWHERPRHTGMATARDSKGNWDDKAISKAHTNARKYFFLALFNIPAGDFEDVDENANQRQEQQPVPGPKKTEEKSTSREAASEEHPGPHKIVLGQGAGPDQWAGTYIKAIGRAASEDEIKRWDHANDETLQTISDRYSKVYEMIEAAVTKRLEQLGATKDPQEFSANEMPEPRDDAQAAMNWVAGELQKQATLTDAVEFWNQKIAPHEEKFDSSDWSMLAEEWRRTRERLAPS